MTSGEKSAAITEWSNPDKDSGNYDFSDVVDKVCEKLIDKQAKYSIQRIQEMEKCLSDLECELDAFLGKAPFLRK